MTSKLTTFFFLWKEVNNLVYFHSRSKLLNFLPQIQLVVFCSYLNIFLGHEYPHLVITDFGCCLADKHNKLTLSYTSPDTYRGGNCALMPPEISSAIPGPFTSISYGKSDLWSAATLAYQVTVESTKTISRPQFLGRLDIG